MTMETKLVCIKSNKHLGLMFGQTYNLVEVICGIGFLVKGPINNKLIPMDTVITEDKFLELYI